jgi:hypothetical protein
MENAKLLIAAIENSQTKTCVTNAPSVMSQLAIFLGQKKLIRNNENCVETRNDSFTRKHQPTNILLVNNLL